MTDTGQVPGEGLPENAGMVEQPGVLAPDAYTYLDHSDTTAEDDDLLLMPGQQGAWGNEMPQPAPASAPYPSVPGPHETAGRDSGSIDLGAVRTPPPGSAPQPAPRRPLHMGPPTPDSSASLVRSLADRGPADAPMRPSGPPTTGPEYLDVPQPGENSSQGAMPWGAAPQTQTVPPVSHEAHPAETVVPAPVPETAPAAEAFEPHHEPQAPAGSGSVQIPQAYLGAEPQRTPHDITGLSAAQSAEFQPAAPERAAVSPEGTLGAAEAMPSAGTGYASGSTPAHGISLFPEPQAVPNLPEPEAGPLFPEQEAAPDVSEPEAAPDVSEPEAAPAAAPAPDAATADAAPLAPVPDAVQPADATPHAGVAVPATDTFSDPDAPGFALDAHSDPQAAEPSVHLADTAAPYTGDQAHAMSPAAPAEQASGSLYPPLADPATGLPAALAPPAEPEHEPEPEAVTAADSLGAVPVGAAVRATAPQASAAQPHGEPAHGEQPAPGDPEGVAAVAPEFAGDHSLGQFVPVEGVVPVTPHLAPTPPHALRLPPLPDQEPGAAEEPPAATAGQDEQGAPASAAKEPGLTVPAPRREHEPPAAEPQDAAPEPVVAQQADDLDTRAAEQEESMAVVEDVRESTGPAAPGYDDAEREAVLRVMRERRDIRNGFRSDPIPHDVLLRVLEAAHTAPSVGHSQPWDFVVIRSDDTRRTMHELAQRQREAYAKSLPKGRAKQFKELKIEAILDTPVNIVVTADPTRGGRHTLGRHTQPQMAPYSSALAVENLWLAARAEGLGVGWVSFFDEREMVRALGLPEHLEVVAYLCVGYVDEFPEEPELMQAGWSKRRPLSWVVHEETYGRRALPGEEPHDLLAETVASIRPLDAKALGEAWERQKRMTKPAGALGMLEIISAQLSGLSRQCPPPIPEPAAVAIFAGDHGVHAQGVTPWPQEVTGQMVANFLGGGAVCNAFAGQVGAEVCVVDVGVASDLPATPGLLPRKVRPGTADMTTGPALTREEVKQAIEVGIETARDLVAAGNKALLTGEMGIANTTASAALISVFTDTDPSEVTGRGTGINDETLARKTEVVRRAIELHQPDPADPIGALAAFGGLEHAAMVGLLLGGASLRTPVILDGVSAGAAALVARAIAPEVLAACIAGHRSAEPGHVAALNKLGLRPLVDLDLRLGEGTGALLALPLVQSAARAMHEVATFDSAGVTEK
ncbi:nicotinate-nucleotide--dimethylbenzimidazole phosphoribosyltransferase [Streptomyces sp. NPDC047022]|uniref:nicotinate-nucleotide--dimethylbenzimidazole phosphoribosyltransferase n=1 Tax=Streptomyces sp. NPDC047022 TaxID=3155737 RepID=UPI0034084D8C